MPTKTTVKVIIPLEDFQRVYAALPKSRPCRRIGCPYSRTTCHVRETLEALHEWWVATNGTAPGFTAYETVLQNAITVENQLYWCFMTGDMKPCGEMYRQLAEQVRTVFRGGEPDYRHTFRF